MKSEKPKEYSQRMVVAIVGLITGLAMVFGSDRYGCRCLCGRGCAGSERDNLREIIDLWPGESPALDFVVGYKKPAECRIL